MIPMHMQQICLKHIGRRAVRMPFDLVDCMRSSMLVSATAPIAISLLNTIHYFNNC